MTAMTALPALPPADPALADGFELAGAPACFLADPYPTYRALREHAPVKRLADGSVFLTRYADCMAVYKDPARFRGFLKLPVANG